MDSFLQIRPVNLREQVIEQIRTAIIEGRLRSKDHIIEKQLTDQLGVSRTPVREALILLEREGLVTAVPNRGFFVRVFSEEDVTHIFSTRTMIENFSGEITFADHECASNVDLPYLKKSIETLQTHLTNHDLAAVRRTDMEFHRYLIQLSRHPLILRIWFELVAQIAALLHLRAATISDFDEFQIIKDHQEIVNAYAHRDLERLVCMNQEINARVSEECRHAVARWEK